MTLKELRKKVWITTFSGIQFYPFEPNPDHILIEDIAHALSHQCRFSGHCPTFYSVAQHSVLVSEICENPMWGLLHDATEAYFADVPAPVKSVIPELVKLETGLTKAVAERFNLPYPTPTCVKTADKEIFKLEWNSFMAERSGEFIEINSGHFKVNVEARKHFKSIIAEKSEIVKKEFLERYKQLIGM